MANETENTDKKGKGKFLFLTLFLIAALVAGGIAWQKYSTLKKADAHLEEAKAFIEARKFERAEETIQFAEETLPDRPETVAVQKLLKTEREIEELEKDLVANLKERSWDKVEVSLSSLKEIDSENVRIPEVTEEVRAGRLSDKIQGLELKLSSAKEADDIEQELALCDELLGLDPSHENAGSWNLMKKAAVKEIDLRNAKAKVIYEQALTLDKGEYNEELLFLATEAKTLSSDKQYETFYSKVNSYPRVITYPADYPSFQEAINAAREIDTIMVTPGDYDSPAIVNKKVKIIGEEGKVVIFHCAGAKGAALHVGPQGDLIAEHIMFKHSDLQVDDKSAYSGVVVEGKASFTACLFYETSGHGLHVLNGGEAKLLSCRSEANAWDGIAVSGEGSKVEFSGSISANNRHNGVDAWDGGILSMVDSFSEKNDKSGAVSSSKGNLKISGSTLKGNNHVGLYVMKDGVATVEASELSENQLAGGFGNESGSVNIVDTKVLNNNVAGIVLAKGTTWSGIDALTYEGNESKEVWKDAEFESLDDVKTVEEASEEVEAETVEGSDEVKTEEATTTDVKAEEEVITEKVGAEDSDPETSETSEATIEE